MSVSGTHGVSSSADSSFINDVNEKTAGSTGFLTVFTFGYLNLSS